MKKIWLIVILVLFLFLTGCYNQSYSIELEFLEDYNSGLVIDLENNTGDLNIVSNNENKVQIKAIVTGRADSQEKAKKIAENIKINSKKSNNVLRISSEKPSRLSNFPGSSSVSYLIKIPVDYSARLKTNTGSINIEEIVGDLEIASNTGNVYIEKVKGNTDIEINTGKIEINEIIGNLNFEGNTGNVSIGFLRGQINGKLNTGNIEGRLELLENSSNKVKTTTGDISLYLLKDNAQHIITETTTGQVRVTSEK